MRTFALAVLLAACGGGGSAPRPVAPTAGGDAPLVPCPGDAELAPRVSRLCGPQKDEKVTILACREGRFPAPAWLVYATVESAARSDIRRMVIAPDGTLVAEALPEEVPSWRRGKPLSGTPGDLDDDGVDEMVEDHLAELGEGERAEWLQVWRLDGQSIREVWKRGIGRYHPAVETVEIYECGSSWEVTPRGLAITTSWTQGTPKPEDCPKPGLHVYRMVKGMMEEQ
jgi:hypothetical protein